MSQFETDPPSMTAAPEFSNTFGSDEFQVTSHIVGPQRQPPVTGLIDGSHVVSWGSEGQDGDENGIYKQMYDSTGALYGNEVQKNSVSTTTNNILTNSDYWNIFVRNFDNNNNPSAFETMVNANLAKFGDNWTDNHGSSTAHLSDGGYVVTWTNLSGRDGDTAGVYAQIYDNAGAKIGSDFQVNTTTSGHQWSMSVAGLSNGGFVISWQSPNSSGSRQINGQIFDSSGIKVGSELTFANIGGNPSVSGFSSGGFVAAWDSGYLDNGVAGALFDSSFNSVASFTTSGSYPSTPRVTTLTNGNFFVIFDGEGISGQLFDPSASKIGGEISISGGGSYPHVTAIENGKFVVSFTKNHNVFKRQYDANGNAEESAVQLYANTSNLQGKVRISSLSDGDYIAVWDETSSSIDRPSLGLYGQRFNSVGSASGSVFKINSSDNNSKYGQLWPSVTKLENGGFAVTWRELAVDGVGPVVEGVTADWGTVLDADESDSDGKVSITTNDVEDGQMVTVVLNGQTYLAFVANNSALVTIPAANLQELTGDTSYPLIVNVSDAAGNAATQYSSTVFEADNLPSTLTLLEVLDVVFGPAAFPTGEFNASFKLDAGWADYSVASEGTYVAHEVPFNDGQVITTETLRLWTGDVGTVS
ncbi:hypothetical protein N9C16_11620, partial [Paracoccaceae bacterium]|nr:hypothetical protein [Paracoccaceae bacterium]